MVLARHIDQKIARASDAVGILLLVANTLTQKHHQTFAIAIRTSGELSDLGHT